MFVQSFLWLAIVWLLFAGYFAFKPGRYNASISDAFMVAAIASAAVWHWLS